MCRASEYERTRYVATLLCLNSTTLYSLPKKKKEERISMLTRKLGQRANNVVYRDYPGVVCAVAFERFRPPESCLARRIQHSHVSTPEPQIIVSNYTDGLRRNEAAV